MSSTLQILTNGQKISFEFQGTNYLMTVLDAVTTGAASGSASARGLLTRQTQYLLESAGGSLIKVRPVASLDVGGWSRPDALSLCCTCACACTHALPASGWESHPDAGTMK